MDNLMKWKNNSKKGAIEIQFNWIFVMIVGVIIFAFFTKVTLTQKEVSEAKVANAVIKDVDTITVGAASSRDTVNLIDLPNIEMEFKADLDAGRHYKIGQSNRRIQNTFIFSPDTIKGKELLAWTNSWNLPFRVTNLIYMTSPLIKYVFMENNGYPQFAEKIYMDFPSEIEKDLENSGTITLKNYNNYKIRFITINESPNSFVLSNFEGMENKDVTAIKINPDHDFDDKTGTVEFYQKDDSGQFISIGKSYYITEEGMYAAIFSDNPSIYNINMRDAFERLGFAAQLYLNRTNILYHEYQNNPRCRKSYSLASVNTDAKLFFIREIARNFSKVFPPQDIKFIHKMYNYSYRDDHVGNQSKIINERDGLRVLNDYALRNSCPEIY